MSTVVINPMNKTYSELVKLKTFQERFDYLKLGGVIGEDTFGHQRYLNQSFYRSSEWSKIRKDVILRDMGKDLALDDYDIFGSVIVHHINPITIDDIINGSDKLTDPENLICVSIKTHNAIHYGDIDVLSDVFVERSKNDTTPWKK